MADISSVTGVIVLIFIVGNTYKPLRIVNQTGNHPQKSMLLRDRAKRLQDGDIQKLLKDDPEIDQGIYANLEELPQVEPGNMEPVQGKSRAPDLPFEDVENNRHRRTTRDKRAVGELLAIVLAWLGSSILSNYAQKSRERRLLDEGNSAAVLPSSGFSEQTTLEQMARLWSDPPSEMFLLAMIAYGASASTMYHLNRNDKSQDIVFTAGVTLSLAGGIIAGESAVMILLRILPCTILLALSVSAIGHRIYRSRSTRVIQITEK